MYKPYVSYEREEIHDLCDILIGSNSPISMTFGVELRKMLFGEFSFSIDPINTGSIKGHKYLQDNYPERYAMLFLRKLSVLPTEMNNEDSVINEIVLWRIKKRKGE